MAGQTGEVKYLNCNNGKKLQVRIQLRNGARIITQNLTDEECEVVGKGRWLWQKAGDEKAAPLPNSVNIIMERGFTNGLEAVECFIRDGNYRATFEDMVLRNPKTNEELGVVVRDPPEQWVKQKARVAFDDGKFHVLSVVVSDTGDVTALCDGHEVPINFQIDGTDGCDDEDEEDEETDGGGTDSSSGSDDDDLELCDDEEGDDEEMEGNDRKSKKPAASGSDDEEEEGSDEEGTEEEEESDDDDDDDDDGEDDSDEPQEKVRAKAKPSADEEDEESEDADEGEEEDADESGDDAAAAEEDAQDYAERVDLPGVFDTMARHALTRKHADPVDAMLEGLEAKKDAAAEPAAAAAAPKAPIVVSIDSIASWGKQESGEPTKADLKALKKSKEAETKAPAGDDDGSSSDDSGDGSDDSDDSSDDARVDMMPRYKVANSAAAMAYDVRNSVAIMPHCSDSIRRPKFAGFPLRQVATVEFAWGADATTARAGEVFEKIDADAMWRCAECTKQNSRLKESCGMCGRDRVESEDQSDRKAKVRVVLPKSKEAADLRRKLHAKLRSQYQKQLEAFDDLSTLL
jgi:hypothetical protein